MRSAKVSRARAGAAVAGAGCSMHRAPVAIRISYLPILRVVPRRVVVAVLRAAIDRVGRGAANLGQVAAQGMEAARPKAPVAGSGARVARAQRVPVVVVRAGLPARGRPDRGRGSLARGRQGGSVRVGAAARATGVRAVVPLVKVVRPAGLSRARQMGLRAGGGRGGRAVKGEGVNARKLDETPI